SALGRDGTPPPSERIRIGHIGVKNQGTSNLKALMKHTVAVCDVDKDVLGKAKALAETGTGETITAYDDYRRLLDNKDIDAVVVTTPDHWHARITIDACAAGKDVYCEKPLTLTVAEGCAVVEAARRHDRVVQTGSQQRSDAKFRRACELVRSGRIGKVHTVRVGIPGVNFVGPAVPDTAPPPELDYDFWLGPAPRRPYNPNRVHYNFRFFWDYSGGQLTNFGAHHLDIAQWALGMDESGPVAVEGQARDHEQGWYEVPAWCRVAYTYPGDVTLVCGQDERGGVTFEGSEGTLFVTRGRIESNPAAILREPPAAGDVRLEVSDDHHANWLDCIRSRRRPIADVAIGHRSATVCHLGNIAIRTGRKLTWDPARQELVGDPEAAAMLRRPYRAPWPDPGPGCGAA
ncbi:MAG TPA: Gfo/Idh/MocA family oxidoreductase, partial [Isosphaeraceae bacterium]